MRKELLFLGVLLGGAGLTGCGSLAPAPMYGWAYTDIKYPSYYDGADNKGPGSKTGTSSAVGILGVVAVGDASVAAAARDGGITTINTVDNKGTSILGIYAKYETIVTGE